MNKTKKLILIIASLLLASIVQAQGGVQLYATSPYNGDAVGNGGLMTVDQASGAPISAIDITLNGTVITGSNGLAVDPSDETTVYIVFKHPDLTEARALGTLDLATGVVTIVGEFIGENVAGITFDDAGQMYAVVGETGANPESLFSVNKADASLTLITALGDGSDGETIGFNSNNGLIYTRSGRDTASAFTSIDPSGPTVVAVGGTTLDEAFSMLFDIDTGLFIEANLDQEMLTTDPANGTQAITGATGSSWYKGMMYYPRKQEVIFYDGINVQNIP